MAEPRRPPDKPPRLRDFPSPGVKDVSKLPGYLGLKIPKDPNPPSKTPDPKDLQSPNDKLTSSKI
jgi:hypothetical protein